MSLKLPTSPRYRKSAKKLFLREKSLKSKNPSIVSVGAIIAGSTSRASEYAKQLIEKQKVRRLYGVSESQFKKYYVLASKAGQNTAETMLQILERRIDNVVYRAGLASTRAESRQMVSHKLIKLNGRRVNIPSILVKTGDEIEPVKKTDRMESLNSDMTPKWLDKNNKSYAIKISNLPARDDVDQDINEQLIVEYYSK
jgi:small subunit ribosomal protein S4